MKLVLFTPAIKSSAIGRMASLVAHKLLAQGHELIIVRTEDESLLKNEMHEFGATAIPWNDSARVIDAARVADAFIYQIGDNYQFHQGCLEWLPRFPGIVCLHDFFLGHLFNGWAQSRRKQADAVLRSWYGKEIADRFFGFSNSEDFIQGTRDDAPMTEWLCSMGQAVITHSSWGCERVLNSCPGPVRVVPLAYDAPGVSLVSDRTGPTREDKFQILTIGQVNPNKRVASVIQAIGDSPLLRDHTSYRLVGHVQPEVMDELSALAKRCGVKLIISGAVDDLTLAHAVDESDVISCLRWPTLEAASASAIEAMLYGKPAIVTNAGFYKEIPDSCALKVSVENEISDLQSALDLLFRDQSQRKAVAASGQQWARKVFTAENYAWELVKTVEATLKARPILNAIDYFCSVMHQWSANPDMLRHEDIARPLYLFEERGSIDPSDAD